MRTRSTLLLVLKLAATTLALGYVFHRWVDTQALLAAIRGVSPAWLGMALSLALLNRWLLAEQFRRVAAEFSLPYGTLTVMKAHLISSFFATVAPGEVASSGASWHYLAREHGAYGKVAGILVFLKLIGYACLTLFALVALLLEPRLAPLGIYQAALITATASILGLVALVHPRSGPFLMAQSRRLAESLPWRRARELISRGVEAFLSVHQLSRSAYGWSIAYAILNNLVGAATIGALFAAAGVDAPWSAWFWLRAVLTIVQTVPLTIAGTGLREITFIYLLQSLYGVEPALAVTGSLLSLAMNLFFGLGIGSILFVLDSAGRKKRRDQSENKGEQPPSGG
jgi:glycosyltransferase 2 family protein